MTNYREILRLQTLGFNNSRIADSTGTTRQTVIAVLQRATAQGVSHQTAEPLSDREYAAQTKAPMHLNRKPGELMEVDWAGQTTAIIDDEIGEVIDAFVFVAVLPYSGYGYVEAFSESKAAVVDCGSR